MTVVDTTDKGQMSGIVQVGALKICVSSWRENRS
jgi:hypothetical protein